MIKIISFFFKFYINASIHVALAVYALLYVFVLNHQLVYDENLMYTVFYGTITGYNFVKYAPIAKLHHRSLTKSLRLIQLFSLICFGALLYYAKALPIKTLLVFLSGFVLVLVYAVPLIKGENLRSKGKVKIYLVAFCWALSVIVAPTIHFGVAISVSFFLEVLQIFILVVALVIPFDIRDLEFDNKLLETLPQIMGTRKAKLLAVVLLVFYAAIEVLLQTAYWWISIVAALVTSTLILKMPKRTIKYYCSFGIESVPIFKLLLLLVVTYF